MSIKKPVFKICAAIYALVEKFIGKHPAERGMMIGRAKDGVIRYCEIDRTGRCTAAAYDPDIKHMNMVIKQWKEEDIDFVGFIHSHPTGIRHPSGHDLWYAGEILFWFKKLEFLWMPIVQTEPDSGSFELIPYAAIPDEEDRKKCEIVECKLDIVTTQDEEETPAVHTAEESGFVAEASFEESPEDEDATDDAQKPQDEEPEGQADRIIPKCKWFGVQSVMAARQGFADYFYSSSAFLPIPDEWAVAQGLHSAYFERLKNHYDLDMIDRTRLIVVGNGGASSFVRNCARMGFSEHILIDPDTVSETNVGTQDALPSAIGMPKVEALGRDIAEINPTASVAAFPLELDAFSDDAFEALVKNPMRWDMENTITGTFRAPACSNLMLASVEPIVHERTILLVLTDSFEAQARGHRLGLHFGIPTICAQEYVEGIGAEVTYTVPGVTPACHRCITASRYRAYLEKGYRNNVTSSGAPVFAAEFLNAVLGHVLLAVAHHGTDHPRWGNVVERLGNRNLLQIRMDNSFDERLGIPAFGSRIAGMEDPGVFQFLDTLFLPQTPDAGQSESRPACPDCGGTGNLSDSIGRLGDTVEMCS
ncbi:ThiF family adenylyltransferase [Pontiellaceae bacterium B12227]|nr:ThiF family adenylyltransferase [Pontiellaceae bacterium B12227]